MTWQKILSLSRDFEDALGRMSGRVETADNRKAQLAWRNYRPWYQKLVRETKQALRVLRKSLFDHADLLTLIDNLASSLKNVFDIESDTNLKVTEINVARQIWQEFKDELYKKIRQEYDLFPQRTFVPDQKLCFVLMPLDKKFKPVYSQAIKPAVSKAKLRAKRADEIFTPTPIVRDIWEYINKATLTIADVTGRNANVFYEVGLAHALPKRLIILTQTKDDVPFDLQYIRWIRYSNTKSGRKRLKSELQRAIKKVVA